MKIYYLEFKDSIKFFFGDNTLEINNDSVLEEFGKYIKRNFGRKIKFIDLIGG